MDFVIASTMTMGHLQTTLVVSQVLAAGMSLVLVTPVLHLVLVLVLALVL